MRLTERNAELVPETTTTAVLWPFFGDHPGEPVIEEKVLDFMVQGKFNRGRHTDHPAGRQSIRTNQCQSPSFPIFAGRMHFLPPNQQCKRTEGKSFQKQGETYRNEWLDVHNEDQKGDIT